MDSRDRWRQGLWRRGQREGRREELAEQQTLGEDAPFFSIHVKDPPWVQAGPFSTEEGGEVGPWKRFFLVAPPAGKVEGGEKELHSVSGRGKRRQDCWAAVGMCLDICGHELGMNSGGFCMDFLHVQELGCRPQGGDWLYLIGIGVYPGQNNGGQVGNGVTAMRTREANLGDKGQKDREEEMAVGMGVTGLAASLLQETCSIGSARVAGLGVRKWGTVRGHGS